MKVFRQTVKLEWITEVWGSSSKWNDMSAYGHTWKRTEEWDVPFSKNVTDEYNCHNSFSIMYSICYECEKKASLFDFNDHQLDSHFRTNRARPTLEAFKNGYCVALLSWRNSSFAFQIMSALTSPWYICKIFATLPTYLNIFKAPHLIIQVGSLTSSFPKYFLAI